MNSRISPRSLAAATAALAALAFAGSAQAATYTVQNSNDSGAGSLREAIDAAGASAGADVIDIPAGTGTIFIEQHLQISGEGPLTINGNGAIVDADGNDQVLNVQDDATLNDLTIQNGYYSTPAESRFASGGGGIFNSANLTLNRVVVRENTEDNSLGGGIYTNGTLTINDGKVSTNHETYGDGGGIFNAGGTVTLHNTDVTGNTAAGSGAGVYNRAFLLSFKTAAAAVASVTVDHGSLTGNLAGSDNLTSDSQGGGGAIYNDGGDLAVTDATIDGNSADGGDGGGVYNDAGFADLSRSAITNNGDVNDVRVYRGGGIYNDTAYFGELDLTNDTIAGNRAGYTGGGIYNVVSSFVVPDSAKAAAAESEADSFLTNVTIADNTAGDGSGGGIAGAGLDELPQVTVTGFASGLMSLQSTIVSGNHGVSEDAVDNCDSAPQSAGGNLENADSCGFAGTGDQKNVSAPKLGALAGNGGPTQTMALAADSPAVDAAVDAGCPGTDQRGVSRPQQARCDIGAYEYQSPAAPQTTPQQPVQQSNTLVPGNPKLAVAGVRRACVAKGGLSIRVRAAVASGASLKSVTVTLDGKRVKVTKRASFTLRINVARLKAGRHRVRITVLDSAGHRATSSRVIARCAQAKPKRRVQPRFTG